MLELAALILPWLILAGEIVAFVLLLRKYRSQKKEISELKARNAQLETILDDSGIVIYDENMRRLTPEDEHQPSWTGEESEHGPERPLGERVRWDETRKRQKR
jgi:hypothetical protein